MSRSTRIGSLVAVPAVPLAAFAVAGCGAGNDGSACTGACAAAWPPLRAAGKPVAGAGLTASKVATTACSDGTPEVTDNGHPLYSYAGDQKPGDANGQGITAFGDGWFALAPTGNMISGRAPNADGTNGY